MCCCIAMRTIPDSTTTEMEESVPIAAVKAAVGGSTGAGTVSRCF